MVRRKKDRTVVSMSRMSHKPPHQWHTTHHTCTQGGFYFHKGVPLLYSLGAALKPTFLPKEPAATRITELRRPQQHIQQRHTPHPHSPAVPAAPSLSLSLLPQLLRLSHLLVLLVLLVLLRQLLFSCCSTLVAFCDS